MLNRAHKFLIRIIHLRGQHVRARPHQVNTTLGMYIHTQAVASVYAQMHLRTHNRRKHTESVTSSQHRCQTSVGTSIIFFAEPGSASEMHTQAAGLTLPARLTAAPCDCLPACVCVCVSVSVFVHVNICWYSWCQSVCRARLVSRAFSLSRSLLWSFRQSVRVTPMWLLLPVICFTQGKSNYRKFPAWSYCYALAVVYQSWYEKAECTLSVGFQLIMFAECKHRST